MNKILLAAFLSLFLVGCGGSGGGDSEQSEQNDNITDKNEPGDSIEGVYETEILAPLMLSTNALTFDFIGSNGSYEQYGINADGTSGKIQVQLDDLSGFNASIQSCELPHGISNPSINAIKKVSSDGDYAVLVHQATSIKIRRSQNWCSTEYENKLYIVNEQSGVATPVNNIHLHNLGLSDIIPANSAYNTSKYPIIYAGIYSEVLDAADFGIYEIQPPKMYQHEAVLKKIISANVSYGDKISYNKDSIAFLSSEDLIFSDVETGITPEHHRSIKSSSVPFNISTDGENSMYLFDKNNYGNLTIFNNNKDKAVTKQIGGDYPLSDGIAFVKSSIDRALLVTDSCDAYSYDFVNDYSYRLSTAHYGFRGMKSDDHNYVYCISDKEVRVISTYLGGETSDYELNGGKVVDVIGVTIDGKVLFSTVGATQNDIEYTIYDTKTFSSTSLNPVNDKGETINYLVVTK